MALVRSLSRPSPLWIPHAVPRPRCVEVEVAALVGFCRFSLTLLGRKVLWGGGGGVLFITVIPVLLWGNLLI